MDFGDFTPGIPFSTCWGYDRGQPVDRYYIDDFLKQHSEDIRGRVLEVKNDSYTRQFGRPDVEREILDIDPMNSLATIIADLANAPHVPDDTFDCIILTQTLQLIFDFKGAISTLHRILKPGGILLLTVPAISPDFLTNEEGSFYWAFFPAAVQKLLAEHFQPGATVVQGRGNMLTSIAFIAGLAQEDLADVHFIRDDEHFPMLVTARAKK